MNREQIIKEYFLAPFDVLLSLKDPRTYNTRLHDTQDDYLEMTGLSDEHIPQLIKIMDLWFDDAIMKSDELSLVFAPIHVWRILGQLKSQKAILPLLTILDPMDKRGDDWYIEEYPYIFRNIGEKALSMLNKYLMENGKHELFSFICVSDCIKEIGTLNPECREASIAILREKLELYNKNSSHLNASLVSNLTDLKAVKTAELIEHAFASYSVDYALDGDWGNIKKRLGVEGMGLAPENEVNSSFPLFNICDGMVSSVKNTSKNKLKAKRKKAKKPRKKNRKKKK